MGILKGSVPVKRFRTATPEQPIEERNRNYRTYAFASIDPNGEEEQTVGWVSRDDQAFDESVVLLARMDVLKPPAAEIKRALDEAIRKNAVEQGKRPTRFERKLLKLEVVKDLRKRIIPKTRFVELEWNPNLGRLRVFTTSKGACEAIVEVFVKTFGVEVDAMGPEAWTRGFLLRTLQARQPGMTEGEALEAVSSGLATVKPEMAMTFGFKISKEAA
jgi:hypothetical protein